MVVVVVVFPALQGFWGKVRRFILRLRCCCFFLSGDQLAHTTSTLYARIGPQWPSVPRRVVCELVSVKGSHTEREVIALNRRHTCNKGHNCHLACEYTQGT